MTHPARLMTALLLGLICLAGCSKDKSSKNMLTSAHRPWAFVPNTFLFWDNPANWTTPYGPAYADVVTSTTQYLPCRGGPIALCYYAGPNPEPCLPTANGRFADCSCFEIPYGPYFVLETAILNHFVYEETVAVCGEDGSRCTEPNSAPVCAAINENRLIPGADLISTFSLACVPTEGLGQTSCGAMPYGGCMTAPCYRTRGSSTVTCQCPTFNGPYQVGETGAQCTLPSPLVWSAAFNPAETGTAPAPAGCVPDAPGGLGCPLLSASTTLPPGTNCAAVCNEYVSCRSPTNVNIETGFTCDATLCTAECNDQDLVKDACSGLSSCNLAAIVALETAASCSCCASQLCGCPANLSTRVAIGKLNALQAQRGIQSQCAINGTLCGN